ncbi:D-inositol-3-phosphate glycosyltransferase [Nocardia africana]|uniref:D-inositol-3-phosphate glycosyltransferase n=1 Tax=Nocardia africana TaxID=134964 RepID=A0A378X680_9NOCA|nr:D-inositol-3-phosphate glycosyltransferase [Nocardia africana]
MLSVHTSPLAQPGTGDAGGMNVYVLQSALQLARRGVEVEIFTRATSSNDEPVVEAAPGVLVRHVVAGPFEGLDKHDLPTQLCPFAAEVLRQEARQLPGYYDLIHSHYWLSGQVGWLARDRWRVPLVHTAHTLAAVKNAFLAEGDTPEPLSRVVGEKQIIAESDRLVANTAEEARQLVELYGAESERIDVVPRVRICPGIAPVTGRPHAPNSVSSRMSRWWRSSAGSSRSRLPMCSCSRRPRCCAPNPDASCGCSSWAGPRGPVWIGRTR